MKNLIIDDNTLYKPVSKSNNLFYIGYKDEYVLSNNGNRFLIVNQPYPIRNRLLRVEDIESIKNVEKVGLKYVLHVDTNAKKTKHYLNRIDKFELIEVTDNEVWDNGLK